MEFWNRLLSGFSHAEVDTLINLLTRLVVVAEGKPRGGKSRLQISDKPISNSKKKP
jgi:hypothetical protein